MGAVRRFTSQYRTPPSLLVAEQVETEADLQQRLGQHNVQFDELSYALLEGGTVLQYSGVLRTRRDERLGAMARSMVSTPGLIEYTLTRISK